MKRKITLILVVCFVILLFSSIVFSDTGGKNLVVLEMKAVEYTSCPYLYVFNGADYQFENDLISVGRTQSNEYTDQLMIGAQLPVSGGFIKLKVEEPPGENCRLDWLQLNAINHPEGTQAGVDEKGQAHTYAFPTAPQVALDQVNQNVTSRVAREDGQGVLLYDGQYITVNFVATDLSKGGKLILQATGFNRDEDLPETIIPKVPALEIQTLENGVWVTRGRFFPKVCAAYGVFDLQKYLDPAAPSIRIKSLSCRTNTAHLIDYLGLDNTPDNCSQEVLPLARALKNGATDVKDLVTASDGSYLEMQGGQDIVNLEFTPPVSTGVNDYFFTSKGFYQEADNTFYVYTKDSSGNFQNRWNSGWNGFQDSSPSNYKTLAIDLTPYVGQNFPDSKDQFIIKIQNRMNWQPQRFAAIDYVCLKIYDETIKDYRLLNLESAWDEATGLGLNLVELAQLKTDDGNPWNAFNRSLILTFGKDNHTNYYNAGFVDFYSYLSHLAGDPVNAATGNFVTQKDDIVVAGFNPISFRRVYNSIGNWQGVLGTNWRHSYEYQLIKTEGKVSITFSDGHMEEFTANPDGSYTPMPGKYGILKPNPAGGHILTQSDQTAYYFSSGGNLTAITDIHGNTTTIFYDNGKITKIQNDSGYLQLEYTGNLLTKVSDQLKRFTLYGYTDGKLTSFTAINGGAYQYSYDSQNRLIRIVDPLGNVKITNTYDSQNRIIGQTMADGSTNSFSYDDSSQITTCAERNGTKTLYKYDQKNRIYETDFPDGVQQVVINDQNQITAAVDKNGNRYSYEYDLKGNITRETNPLGDVTEYSYDNHNRLTSVREPDGGLYEYRYDSLGNLIASRDPLGREVKLEYNSKGLPVKVFMPDGSFSEAGYDARGNAVTVKDPLGNVTLNQYDDLNRLSGVIKPNGGQIRYEYTADGNLQKVTLPDGTFSTAQYDPRGLLLEETDPNGNITKYQYNSVGKLIEKTDPLGGITKYEYDSMWNITKMILADGSEIKYSYNPANRLASITDALSNTRSFQYDPNGNLLKSIDPRGFETNYVYDALNRLVQTTNGNQAATRYEYRYDGKIRKIVDALNNATEYHYDAAGQLVSVKDALGFVTGYTYNSLGYLTAITDQKGATTRYEYDFSGKVIKATYPDGTSTMLSYDKNGNLAKATDANGNNTIYGYDSLDRLLSITDAAGNFKEIKYTKTGKVSCFTDENGNATSYQYDALDRLTTVIDAKGNRTVYGYDATGNLIEVHRFVGVTQETIAGMNLGANGKDHQRPGYVPASNELITKYQYDRLGQLIQETSPAGKIIVYRYDAGGNLISQTDQEGNTTEFEYDAVNNLNQITYQDGKQVRYGYNPLNQLTGMNDWLGNTIFELDALGRIKKATDYQNQVLQYTWGPMGEKRAITYPDGSTVKYEYDLMGRLVKVNDPQNKTTGYQYDSLGNLKETLLPNGIRSVYHYDSLSRLILQTDTDKSGRVLEEYRYVYDAVGNRLKITRNQKGNESHGAFEESDGETLYTYDQLNQLTSVIKPNRITEKYFYDTLGNRVRQEYQRWKAPIYAIDYQYDTEGRLVRLTGGGGWNAFGKKWTDRLEMAYDQRGNLTGVTCGDFQLGQYSFDASNRLAGAVNWRGDQTTYTYNGFGQRVALSVDSIPPLCDIERYFKPFCDSKGAPNGNDKYTAFFNWLSKRGAFDLNREKKQKSLRSNYIFDITSLYGDVLMIENDDQTVQKYTIGLNILSVDTANPKKDEQNRFCPVFDKTDRYYYLQDELGSTSRLLAENGRTAACYGYNAFGALESFQGWDDKQIDNPFLYTGYQYDGSTGLYYARARYYLPEIGRFTSEDSYPGSITNPKSLNRYVYCNNNPLKYVDPSGHNPTHPPVITNGLLPAYPDPIYGQWSYDELGACEDYFQKVSHGLPGLFQVSMPLSGYERKYDQTIEKMWNDMGNYQFHANCYAYAFNVYTPDKNDQTFRPYGAYPTVSGHKLQPGEYSGKKYDQYQYNSQSNSEYAHILIQASQNDANQRQTVLKRVFKYTKCAENNWKVALVLQPGGDYHWYRQNPDGTWSSKMGEYTVSNQDATGQTIYDPQTANRGIYTQFVGYFEVSGGDNSLLDQPEALTGF